MHLLSDCRQNNNLTKGSRLCKAGWPVNKKLGGGKYSAEEEKTHCGVEGGTWKGVLRGQRLGWKFKGKKKGVRDPLT